MNGYLSTAETLKLLGVSRNKLKSLIASGVLKVYRLGSSGTHYFKVEELEKTMQPKDVQALCKPAVKP